MYMYTSVDSPF